MRRGRPFPQLAHPGDRHGYLVAVSRAGSAKNGSPLWLYRCDCGNEVVARSNKVRSGDKSSCGCHWHDHVFKHGLCRRGSAAPEYGTYAAMLRRCGNPGQRNYAGRGIKVCRHWADSFENFLADMGSRPSPDHSIDRIDPDGNYEPSNCRWATRSTQINNRRCTPRYLYEGELLPVNEISERCGTPADLLRSRLMNGWEMQRAITQPKQHQVHNSPEAGRPSRHLQET